MISIKKLATVGAAGALLLASAVPVFATGGHHRSNDELNIDQDNDATIINVVETEANTGDNSIGGRHSSGSGRISTGDAYADGLVSTEANLNRAELDVRCGCYDEVELDQDNDAFVLNKVETEAETGDNSVSGGSSRHHHGGGSVIRTGDASALSTVFTVVNKNVAIVD